MEKTIKWKTVKKFEFYENNGIIWWVVNIIDKMNKSENLETIWDILWFKIIIIIWLWNN